MFFPGGDPGDNAAQLVVPFLKDTAARLARHHPRAKVWLSLQHFDAKEIDFVLDFLSREKPDWFGGLVAGPGSPPLAITRARLDPRYPLRDYPDITHTVRTQYPLPWWDPAFNFTLGREPINPRPVFYAALHDRIAPHTNGFISYSDGVNDDVNKAVWSRKSWSPEVSTREALIEYARYFFGDAVAERAADGIFALEKNWEGPLATNGSVDGTLMLWQQLEREQPSLAATNWRWQMNLFRAYYDAYTRQRLIFETALEHDANRALAQAGRAGSAAAIDEALKVLRRADVGDGQTFGGCCPVLRQRIEDLAASLFASIRMQTSMTKYSASGAERGAVLDQVDYPLNNRWWLEDEFAKVRALPDEASRVARLDAIRTWEDPGPGSFYDDVAHVGRAPHVIRARAATGGDAFIDAGPIPHFVWEDQGKSRKRLSWQTSLRWPLALVYDQIDPAASYVVRLNGPGDIKLKIDDEPIEPVRYSKTLGELKEYRVPAAALADRKVVLTFDPIDESHLNWRQHSRLSEVWLIKQPPARSRHTLEATPHPALSPFGGEGIRTPSPRLRGEGWGEGSLRYLRSCGMTASWMRCASVSCSSRMPFGTRPPKPFRNCSCPDTASTHSAGSTFSSAAITSSDRSSPVRSIAWLVGSSPIGVSVATPRPSQRSMIHFNTRRLSPKPGQR